MKVKASDLAIDLMGEACEKAVIPGDYVIIEGSHYGSGHISYSRYFPGGSYISAANFNVFNGVLVVTQVITGIPEGWKHGEKYEVPMTNPEIIDLMSEFMRTVFSQTQKDRRPMTFDSKSPRNSRVQIRYGKGR